MSIAGISRDEVSEIAGVAADKAIERVFEKLGIDVGDPFAMQRDFAFVRISRRVVEGALAKTMLAGVVGMLAIGGLFVLRSTHLN